MAPKYSILQASGVTVQFGDVVACDDVSLSLRSGEIHAIVGENGAGKSTLMHVLAGSVVPNSGQLALDASPLRLRNSQDAQRHGIGMVYQDFLLVVHEPAQGLDLHAARFVYEQLLSAARQGTAVLLISSDLDEILALSHEIQVLYRGRIVATFARFASKDAVGSAMAGMCEVAGSVHRLQDNFSPGYGFTAILVLVTRFKRRLGAPEGLGKPF